MNSFLKSNLQQTDIQSLQSRIISIKKLSLVNSSNKEYTELLKLYERYLNFKDSECPILSPFAKKLRKVKRALNSPVVQESPIITIGTMLRILSVDESLEAQMLKVGPENLQIISFGAGSDLRFQQNKYSRCANIIELDFKDSVDFKRKCFPPRDNLTYIECDITKVETVKSSLLPLLRENMHTVILMECLLCYLPIEVANSYFAFFNKIFTQRETNFLHYVIYDPVSLSKGDSFTRIMFDNLSKFNHLQLNSLKEIDTLDAYIARFKNENLQFDCQSLWEYVSSRKDKEDLFKLCLIDEFEELLLLLSHYIILRS